MGKPIAAHIVAKRRAGHAARIAMVTFWMKPGSVPKTDRRAPFSVRLPNHLAAGARARIFARVRYRLPGSRRVHIHTTSRRLTVCPSA